MRVLYIHYMDPESGRGGMGVHIRSSTEALRALGHEVLVLGKRHKPETAAVVGPLVDRRTRLRRQVAKYVYEPRALLRGPFRLPRELRAARAFRPDVAVVRYEAFEYQMWIVCAVLRIPLVVEVNATTRELQQWKRDEVYVYPSTRWFERTLLRRAERLFAVSTILKGLLVREGLAANRIAVIPNGADADRFHPDVDPTVVRHRHGLGSDVVVGFLGSFGRWHDIALIADVIPGIVARHPNVQFLMAGATLGDLPAQLREKYRAAGDRVVFTGVVPLDEAPLHVAAMDIALTLFAAIPDFGPSVIKQFEYMSAGRAVIATAIGQQAEIVQDGVNGILVDPGDAEGLAAALHRLIGDPALRKQLGHAARATIVRAYTWRHNAERMIELCEQAIRERGRTVVTSSATQKTEA
jgi:glycosyltransferase involved in cell wall biosynthesis